MLTFYYTYPKLLDNTTGTIPREAKKQRLPQSPGGGYLNREVTGCVANRSTSCTLSHKKLLKSIPCRIKILYPEYQSQNIIKRKKVRKERKSSFLPSLFLSLTNFLSCKFWGSGTQGEKFCKNPLFHENSKGCLST